MREIKFRAWNKIKRAMFDPMPIIDFTILRINGCTLMQYTGLKDDNEVEIYEGDIVRCWDNAAKDPALGLDKIHIGYIDYTPDCYSLRIPGKQTYNTPSVKSWENDVLLEHWSNAENIEVIGNIYENPELLTPNPLTP